MIIAFEGMDGSGKSTIAKKVANNIGIEYQEQKIASMLNVDIDTFKKMVRDTKLSNNNKLTLFLYLFKCMYDNASHDFITERSILSLYYFEHNNASDDEFNYFLKLGVVPDLIFVLYASVEERKNRIAKRNLNDPDLKNIEALSDGYPIMIDFAKKNSIPFIVINTENKSEDEVSELVTSIINEYKALKDEEKETYLKEKNSSVNFNKRKVLINNE